MKDKVVWLGAVPYEEIPKIYHNASIFVCASTCETFGQTVLEAMASGLPIACSNRSPMKELTLRAYELSKKYTWEDCAKQTFDFLWKTSGND